MSLGFDVLDVLHQGKHSAVFRARYKNEIVIVKTHPLPYGTPSEVESLEREYKIGRLVMSNSAHVPRYLQIVSHQHDAKRKAVAIVMADSKGQPLSSLIPAKGFPLDTFLDIAIESVKGLRDIHRHNIIHKDVKPANMIYNQDTGSILHLDFGCSTRVQEEIERDSDLKNMYGTLAYLSPEQTGRINRTIDWRTDFYSLGVTFYQLLTGHLPFSTTDIRELIHNHVASEPPPLPNSIPLVLRHIVMKLLCKDATERYKSCAGLLYDLERCKQLLQIYNNGVFDIEYFNIAEDDVLERFIVPTKLYGRDNEIELLQNTFRSVSTQGTSRMVLVSGYSGVGKSSLVREVQRSAQIRNGYFISGKFDQLERNIAYTAFSDALQGLVKQVLGESDQLVETWKQKILDALGTNANVLIELIPELVKLVGKQPPVIPIGPQEAKNRFDSTMQKFLNLFLTEETQLVIFLDDLQWADRGSLDLIQLLLENKYLLFIGAYRDNEVGAKHPTMQMIENIRNSAVPVLDIVLKPLSYETVHEWIVDTLQEQENAQAEQTDDDKRTFSELVYQKTEGNPFFVKMFLQTLNDEGLLIREGKSWRWNISSIKKQSVTDNVVNLMTHRLEQFSGATREAIKWASCLGNNFDFNLIAAQLKKTKSELLEDFYPILNSGMGSIINGHFYFAHDRVQEAAYSLLSASEKPRVHFDIGKRWLACLNESDTETVEFSTDERSLFDIVDHLNKGVGLIAEMTSNEQKKNNLLLAELNLNVGKKAHEAIAYQSAINYLNVAKGCFEHLSSDPWAENHVMGYNIHHQLATTYAVMGDFTNSEIFVGTLLKRAISNVEFGRAAELQIQHKNVLSKFNEALQVGIEVMKKFDVYLSTESSQLERNLQEIKDKLEPLRKGGVIDYTPLLVPLSEETEVLYSIASTLMVTAYLHSPGIFPILCASTINLMFTRGLHPDSCTALCFMGNYLCSVEQYTLGYEMAEISLALAKGEFSHALSQKCKSFHLYSQFIHHWFKHIRDAIPYTRSVNITGLECGETAYAVYSYSCFCPIYLYCGDEVALAVNDLEGCLALATRHKNTLIIGTIQGLLLVFEHLGSTGARNLEQRDKELEASIADNPYALYHQYVYKLFLEHLFYHEVPEQQKYIYTIWNVIKKTDAGLPFIASTYASAVYKVYVCLWIIRLLSLNIPTSIDNEMRLRLDKEYDVLKSFAARCPENWKNKLLMVEAEKAAYVDKKGWAAIETYQEAVHEAEKQGFPHEYAQANELQARFLLKLSAHPFAKACMKQAYSAYTTIGWQRKADQLLTLYPDMLHIHTGDVTEFIDERYRHVTRESSSASTNTLNVANFQFDLESILQASRVISSAIDMDSLLENIIKIIVETAGATHASIIIDGNVQAEYVNNETKLCHLPLHDWNGSTAVVQHVASKQEVLVTGCAYQEKRYKFMANDNYIQTNKSKSILCMPVVHKMRISAILYVENVLTADCFKAEQINVLGILTSQVAISLENSRYFKDQITSMQELAEVQRQIAQNESMYRRVQEEFIDRICHEIRNPIQGVVGNCDVIMGTIRDLERIAQPKQETKPLIDSLRICTTAVQVCAKYQKVITDDVLTLSKLEFQQVKLNTEPFSIRKLVVDVLKMFEAEITNKKLGYKWNIDALADGLILVGDTNRISQVLMNLISNAIKFTARGSIAVTGSVQPVQDQMQVRIIVEDTGCGMTVEETQRIFNRFAQATQRTFADYGGSGLGLFICKNLVELMGGNIEVSSVKWEMSRFSFTVMCDVATEEQIKQFRNATEDHVQTEQPIPKVDTQTRALVVEDNKINQKVLVRMLEKASCTCTVANDGVEGLEHFTSKSFDLVFMDVAMPRMDGYECTRKIREYEKDKNLKAVPIIGLSGNVRQEHHDMGYEAGMTKYMNKPIQIDEILKIVSMCSNNEF